MHRPSLASLSAMPTPLWFVSLRFVLFLSCFDGWRGSLFNNRIQNRTTPYRKSSYLEEMETCAGIHLNLTGSQSSLYRPIVLPGWVITQHLFRPASKNSTSEFRVPGLAETRHVRIGCHYH
ncbi:hypothetical protein V8C42DRAFT_303475 [Trichoderma barbatum]